MKHENVSQTLNMLKMHMANITAEFKLDTPDRFSTILTIETMFALPKHLIKRGLL